MLEVLSKEQLDYCQEINSQEYKDDWWDDEKEIAKRRELIFSLFKSFFHKNIILTLHALWDMGVVEDMFREEIGKWCVEQAPDLFDQLAEDVDEEDPEIEEYNEHH